MRRSKSARSAITIRNVASERRSAPKISTTFAYAQRCTDGSFGVALTPKGPRLRKRRGQIRGRTNFPSNSPHYCLVSSVLDLQCFPRLLEGIHSSVVYEQIDNFGMS